MLRRLFTILILGLLLFLSSFILAETGNTEANLSARDIELFLKVYDNFSERLNLLLNKTSSTSESKSDFVTALGMVSKKIDRAEKEACKAHGVKHSRYRTVFRQVLSVQAYVQYSEIRDELVIEIQKKQHMTEEDIQKDAERSFQETEEWFAGFHKELEAAYKSRDNKTKNYIEQIAEQNEKNREYNQKTKPSPTVIKLQEAIAIDKAKLQDPRYKTMAEGIERNIDKMEKVLARLEKKDNKREKKEKFPDPRVIASFNQPIKNVENQIASYESNIMQPMRDRKASGRWIDDIKRNNEKKINEHQGAVKQIEKFLSRPRLKQAAKDFIIVNQEMDRKKLMSLMPFLPDDRPSLD